MEHADIVENKNIIITDSFWKEKQNLIIKEVLPYQRKALEDGIDGAEPSYCLENFRKAAKAVETRRSGAKTPIYPTDKWHYTPENSDKNAFLGWVFQDSDLYKWIEAAAYALEQHPNHMLEKEIDAAVDLICRSSQEDGYIDSLYTINDPAARFSNLRDAHELYCFGHLAQAACAYFAATHKDKLLNAACRFADLICEILGKNGKPGYGGHPLAEEGLLKLYDVTGKQKYLETARLLINRRGTRPYYFDSERGEVTPDSELKYLYNQAHLPVREQKEATGHAVRAVYLYTAIAHLAAADKDSELLELGKNLFDDITQKKMYITGGIGSSKDGESFTFAYDLPNDTAYAESCASIGLVFFARRMMQSDFDSKYFNTAERCLYNGILSGIALDGKSFFYTNPLEADPTSCKFDPGKSHIKAQRQKWFDCACCPPNIARLISGYAAYCFTQTANTLFINLYQSCKAKCKGCDIEIESDYLNSGKVSIKIKPKQAVNIALRIPDWCDHFKFSKEHPFIRKGYAYFEIEKEETIKADFCPRVRIIKCNPAVRANIGKVALSRGPFIYCLEEKDNGKNLHLLRLSRSPKFSFDGENITANGFREEIAGTALYSEYRLPREHMQRLKFIPYYKWANRGENEMTVYIRY